MQNNSRKVLWIILISLLVCVFIVACAIVFVLISKGGDGRDVSDATTESSVSIDESSQESSSNIEASSEAAESSEAELSVDDTQERIDECLEQSRNLLNNGKMREALVLLLEFKETTESEEINQEINYFLKRVSFSTSIENCKSDNKFIDGSYSHVSGTKYKDIGIVLVDSSSNRTQLLGAITMKYVAEWPIEDNDTSIIGYNSGRFLFSISSGPERASTFIYDIRANKLKNLNSGLTNIEIYDDTIIGNTITLAVNDESTVCVYDWNGKSIKKVSTVGNCTVIDNEFYYVKIVSINSATMTYRICKSPLSGDGETTVCNIELSNDSYLYLEGRHIKWHSDGKDGNMNLQNAYDITK